MRLLRLTAASFFALVALGAGIAAENEVSFVTTLSPACVKTDPPTVEQRILIKSASVTIEWIPAVYQDINGQKVEVKPEVKIEHPVPAIYESRTIKLAVDGDLAQKLKVLAEKSAKVEIVGVRGGKVLKVTGLNEMK